MRNWMITAGTFALAVSAAAVASQQQAVTPAPIRSDAAISGVVIDGVTKQPIEDAVVQIGVPNEQGFTRYNVLQFTDSKGRFVFADLPAGAGYAVRADKPGYFGNAAGGIGQQAWTGPPIELKEGQWLSSITVTLWPPASISGTVVDERGEPVIGVYVRPVTQIFVGGVPQWASGVPTLTDDRGMYRIGSLQAGRYLVMVPSAQQSLPASARTASMFDLGRAELATLQAGGRPELGNRPNLVDVDSTTSLVLAGYPVPPPPVGGRNFAYPIAFAGALSVDQATPIVLSAGEDRSGVDVRITPVPAARVSGVIDGPADARANLSLRLVPAGLDDFGWGGEAATTVSGPDGSFTFANVPAGNYVLETPAAMSQYTIGPMGIFYTPRLPTPPGGRISATGELIDSMPGIMFTGSESQATMWARTQVSVRVDDQSGIVVSLRPTITLSGRLVAETLPNFPEPSGQPRFVNVQAAAPVARLGRPRSVSSRNVQPGQFAIEGIRPGAYFLRSEERGWLVKSVIVAGQDRTHRPIDLSDAASISDIVVTFTNAIPTLSGAVTDDGDGAAKGAAIIAFPVEPEQWTNYGLNPVRIKAVPASASGNFALKNIPAGNYYVIALPADRLFAWREVDFFKRAQSLATRTTIDWGEQKSLTLKVSSVR